MQSPQAPQLHLADGYIRDFGEFMFIDVKDEDIYPIPSERRPTRRFSSYEIEYMGTTDEATGNNLVLRCLRSRRAVHISGLDGWETSWEHSPDGDIIPPEIIKFTADAAFRGLFAADAGVVRTVHVQLTDDICRKAEISALTISSQVAEPSSSESSSRIVSLFGEDYEDENALEIRPEDAVDESIIYNVQGLDNDDEEDSAGTPRANKTVRFTPSTIG